MDISSIFENYRNWLTNPTKNLYRGVIFANKNYISKKTTLSDSTHDGDIILIQQFYIPKNNARYKETLETLRFNANNPFINKIILLNEQIYSDKQLGINSDKITQININKRLTYMDVFDYASTNHPDSYIILANSDIFFDNSIEILKKTNLHNNKKMFTLLRFEYNGENNLNKCTYKVPRPDSQDTWIWHTNKVNFNQKQLKLWDFHMGIGGCDNHFVALANLFGFECYNEPYLIRNYHNHKSQIRTWGNSEKITQPYSGIYPVINTKNDKNTVFDFDIFTQNNTLINFINNAKKPFYIPSICDSGNEIARFGKYIEIKKGITIDEKSLKKCLNDGGFKNSEQLIKYSNKYLKSIEESQLCFWSEPGKINTPTYMFYTNFYKKSYIDYRLINVANLIYIDNPWINLYKNKKIGIYSDFLINTSQIIDAININPDNIILFKNIHDIDNNIVDVVFVSTQKNDNEIVYTLFKKGISAISFGIYLPLLFKSINNNIIRKLEYGRHLFIDKSWLIAK